MAGIHLDKVIRHIRKMVGPPATSERNDAHLLQRFASRHEQAAFATLVERHGPMVLGVCRRVLRNSHDAEDAFQATFLVLVRKAGCIRKHESVASWLYGVAYRTAVKARTGAARRRALERQVSRMPQADPLTEVVGRELHQVLDDELNRLPEKYRVPLVLYYLDGKTTEETAQELGWPSGTVWGRLSRARELLRSRLARRGLTLTSGLLATLLGENAPAAVPASLTESTIKAGLLIAAGQSTAGVISAHAAALAARVMQVMLVTRLKTAALALLVLAVIGSATAILLHQAVTDKPSAQDRTSSLAANGDQTPRPRPAAEAKEQREAVAIPDWPLFRGNASRSAQGRGNARSLTRTWHEWSLRTQNSVSEHMLSGETKKWIEEALQLQQPRKEVMIPAFFPVAAAGQVIYRSYWGIHAVDIKTGNFLWNSYALASLDMLARGPLMKQQAREWFDLYLKGGAPSIVFENSSVGTLSTDGARVYAIDDLALPPHPDSDAMRPLIGGKGGLQIQGALRDDAMGSRLVAIDVDSGKIIWERPAHMLIGPNDPLQKSYFLGPPLPLDGKLYVLTENSKGELELLSLSSDKGEVHWSAHVATARKRLLLDPGRRIQAVHLSYSDGILVCPTNNGSVIGVDLQTHKPIWSYKYREEKKEAAPSLNPAWRASAPIIQDGKVVFSAPDGNSVYCLKLRDGSFLWKVTLKDGLYVAGVYAGKVVVVYKNSCHAHHLPTGKPIWTLEEIGQPAGLGIASDNIYYLPLKSGARTKAPEICAIDLTKGQIVAHTKMPNDEVPGNLLFYQRYVLSQTVRGLSCYKTDSADGPSNKKP